MIWAGAAEFFRDQDQLDRAAAFTTVLLGEREREPAKIGSLTTRPCTPSP
jgi:hypothetical protein